MQLWLLEILDKINALVLFITHDNKILTSPEFNKLKEEIITLL